MEGGDFEREQETPNSLGYQNKALEVKCSVQKNSYPKAGW